MAKGTTEFNDDNRGVLWINNDANSENSPTRRGNIKIRVKGEDLVDNADGTYTLHRYISAWDQESDKCGEYISIAVGNPVPATHGETDDS